MLKSATMIAATLFMGFALASPVAAFADDNSDQPASCHDNCRIIITDHPPEWADTTCHDNCTVYATSIDDAYCHDHCLIVDHDQDDYVSNEPGDCHDHCDVIGNVDGAYCHDNCLIIGQREQDCDHGDHGHGSYGGGQGSAYGGRRH